MASLQPIEKIRKARLDLQKGHPFFGYLVLYLQIEDSEELSGGTAGVKADGSFYYSPDFIDQLSQDQVEGLLAHEVMHLALKDFLRQGNRDHHKWNVAMTIKINDILKNDERMNLPENGILPEHDRSIEIETPRGKHRVENINDKSTEQIFDEVHDKLDNNELQQMAQDLLDQMSQDRDSQQRSGQGSGQSQSNQDGQEQLGQGSGDGDDDQDEQEEGDSGEGSGDGDEQDEQQQRQSGSGDDQYIGNNPLGFDEHIPTNDDGEEVTDGDESQVDIDWQKVVNKAAQHAKDRGELPGSMERMVDQLTDTQVDWRAILHNYISKSIPFDYDFTRPSKKSRSLQSAGHSTHLPQQKTQKIQAAVAIDTSGSISDAELGLFVTEMMSIFQSFSQVELKLIHHDSKVHEVESVDNYNRERLLDEGYYGGGGTDHRPVFQEIEDNRELEDVDILINFTDGYTAVPDEQPRDLETVWILTNEDVGMDRLKFGKIVRATGMFGDR